MFVTSHICTRTLASDLKFFAPEPIQNSYILDVFFLNKKTVDKPASRVIYSRIFLYIYSTITKFSYNIRTCRIKITHFLKYFRYIR